MNAAIGKGQIEMSEKILRDQPAVVNITLGTDGLRMTCADLSLVLAPP